MAKHNPMGVRQPPSGALPASGALSARHSWFTMWIPFVGGALLMACAGTIYLYPVYSEDLGEILGFSLNEMQTVGTMMNAGTWFGVLAGWIYDYTTLKCGGSVGPRVSGLAGVALVFIGYGCMYLAAARRITISFYVLGLCAFVMGQGSGFLYVAALNPNAANVGPRHEGKIIGIMVCFFGLSAGIFSQIFKGFCGGDVTTLLAVLALGIPVTGFAAASVMTLVPRAEVLAAQRRARSGSATLAVDGFGGSDPMGEPRAPVEVYDPLSPAEFTARTHTALGIVVLMILVIGGSSVVNAVDSSSPPFAFAVALVVLLGVYTLIPFMPLRLLQVVTLGSHRGGAAGLTEMDAAASSPLLGKEGVTGPTAGTDADEGGGTQSSASVPLENTLESPLLTTLRTLDFWLLLLAFMCCIGASVASVDNLDRIVDSKASPTSSKQWRSAIKVGSTGIFSVFNTLGRLLVGFLSDRLSRHVSRAAFLVTACFTMLVSQVWLAFATPDMVYGAAAIQGLSHGGLFCVFPMLVCRYFGLKHFGANWGFAGLAPAVGSELMGALLMPALFKRACGSTSAKCFDTAGAYEYTLLINAGACGVGLVASWIVKNRRLKAGVP